MLRRLFPNLWLAAALLTACQPVASPPPGTPVVPTETFAATPIPHADAIRLALIGETNLTNVWAYYDEPGAAYNNRAVQAEFWPSLYHIAPGSGAVEPYLAGTILPLEPDDGFLASSVTLRANLFWSDGSPLTAGDVAFTVNTALKFRLGLDWYAAYNPDILDHAVALNSQTVRFYFRVQPAIEDWQYGALQGPIVHAAYWGPKVEEAASALTPNPDLDRDILDLQTERARLARELNDLLSQLKVLDPASASFAALEESIYRRQDEINSLEARIAEKEAEKEIVFTAARQVLYGLPAQGEPVFGPFVASKRARDEFENEANPFFPFTPPNFDRAVYRVYRDEASAVKALYNGEVNVVLNANGVSSSRAGASSFARSNLRVLVFNLNHPPLTDVNLRRAVVCMLALESSASLYEPRGLLLSADQFGVAPGGSFPCAGFTESERLAESVRVLAEAGYAWAVEPAWEGAARAGSGLRRGVLKVPQMTLLVAQEDSLRVDVANEVAGRMRVLGLSVEVETVESPVLLVRVFDLGQYDMAILGWRVARVPSYLCDWFGDANLYGYWRAELGDHCAAFGSALDLDVARQEARVIESLLAQDLPLAPLYSEVGYDLFAGVTYPFANVLDGLTGIYGAPWLAIPVLP